MSTVKTRPRTLLLEASNTQETSSGRGNDAAKGKAPAAKSRPPQDKKNGGGRPPKFAEPSRPITLTLPESTLQALQQIDRDRGQAIVKLAQNAMRQGDSTKSQVEIMEMAANIGLLIIGPSAALRRIPFLHLVEVAPARFLMALDPGNDFKNLEIAIHDVLEDVPKEETRERELIAQLLEHIRKVRKSSSVRMAEILFVNIEGKRRR